MVYIHTFMIELLFFLIFALCATYCESRYSNGYFCHGPPKFEETGTVSDDWKVLLDMDGYSLVYYIVYT